MAALNPHRASNQINRALEWNVFGQVAEAGLEPVFISRFLTREQVDRYQQVVEGFLWPNEEVVTEDRGEAGFGDRRWKVTLPRTPWAEEYPLDEDASVIYYEADTHLHLLMDPEVFLWWATSPDRMTPEEFKASINFSESSYRSILERIQTGKVLDPLFLDVSWEEPHPRLADIIQPKWEVVAHEGRHRALAAHDSVLSTVPVILFVRVDGDLTPLWDLDDEQVRALRAWAGRMQA